MIYSQHEFDQYLSRTLGKKQVSSVVTTSKTNKMNKNIALLALLLIVTLTASAQVKLGLKFSPSINNSRSFLPSDTINLEAETGLFRFSLGLIADMELTDTYYLSSGVIVVPKRIGMNISPENTGSFAPSTQYYDLQYVQIPATLKLFTNEIIPDGSLYFQVGGAADIKVFEQPVEEEYDFIGEFTNLDLTVVFGGGFEYQAGLNTALFGGVTYNRGLTNVVKTTSSALSEDFSIRTSVLMIDLGLKF